MKKSNDKFLTRAKLADKRSGMSLDDRLKNSKSIDLQGNSQLKNLKNGYFQINPINKNKKN